MKNRTALQKLECEDKPDKAIPDAFAKGIDGVVLHPIRVNYLETRSYNL